MVRDEDRRLPRTESDREVLPQLNVPTGAQRICQVHLVSTINGQGNSQELNDAVGCIQLTQTTILTTSGIPPTILGTLNGYLHARMHIL